MNIRVLRIICTRLQDVRLKETLPTERQKSLNGKDEAPEEIPKVIERCGG